MCLKPSVLHSRSQMYKSRQFLLINYCFVQVYIGTYNHLEAYNCNFFYAHFFVCNAGHQRANYQLFTTNNIPYRLFSTYSWTIMEMENPGTKGPNATVFFFLLCSSKQNIKLSTSKIQNYSWTSPICTQLLKIPCCFKLKIISLGFALQSFTISY